MRAAATAATRTTEIGAGGDGDRCRPRCLLLRTKTTPGRGDRGRPPDHNVQRQPTTSRGGAREGGGGTVPALLALGWGSVTLTRAGARAVLAVGTLKDGYIRRVPLPRVPPIQSMSPVACATIHRNPTHTGYSPIARIPTWSDMIESLSGFGRCIERYIPPYSPFRLM